MANLAEDLDPVSQSWVKLSIKCPYCECGFCCDAAQLEHQGETRIRKGFFNSLVAHLIAKHPEKIEWEPENVQ